MRNRNYTRTITKGLSLVLCAALIASCGKKKSEESRITLSGKLATSFTDASFAKVSNFGSFEDQSLLAFGLDATHFIV